jgi:hypothetical protein
VDEVCSMADMDFWERKMKFSKEENYHRQEEEIEADERGILIDIISEFITPPQKIYEILEAGLMAAITKGPKLATKHWLEIDLESLQKKHRVMSHYAEERQRANRYKDYTYDRIDEG